MERLPEVRVDTQPDHIRRQRGKRAGKSTCIDMVKHKERIAAYGTINESLPTGVELKRTRTCRGWDGPYIYPRSPSSVVHPIVDGFQTVGLWSVVQH